MFIWTFVHLRNPINVRQIELLRIWLYSEGRENRFVVVQHLWCRKICQIVCKVSRKWMESKFFDQDVDVASLANKGIVIGCFVGRNYNEILIETGKLTGNIRVTKNGLGSGVDRIKCFSRRILRFTSSPIDLNLSIQKEFRVRHPLSWPIAWRQFHMHPW